MEKQQSNETLGNTSQLPPFSVSTEPQDMSTIELRLGEQVIRNPKAEMFNRKASDPKNKPYEVLKALELQQGQKVADIGAGGGYFSLQFAEIVGADGRVFAVDTNPQFLDFIKKTAKEKGLGNVVTILTEKDKPTLLGENLNLIFMRNVCHHLANRAEYFKKLKDALKPEGKIAIIEYRRDKGFSFHRLFGHYVQKEKIIKEMEQAGYQLEKDLDFLPEQSFTVFHA
jgi:arsenite methyltransferase